jgi:hypothetical protein
MRPARVRNQPAHRGQDAGAQQQRIGFIDGCTVR